MSWHESGSTPSLSVLPLARLPSIFEQRHSPKGRQDLERPAKLVLREGLCGSVEQETNYLENISMFDDSVPKWRGTFQNIQTYTPKLINVGVIYLRKESDLWWCHRIVIREEELELEDAPCHHSSADSQMGFERRSGPSYGDCEGPCIITSKYLRLSSCGTALIPGTLSDPRVSRAPYEDSFGAAGQLAQYI